MILNSYLEKAIMFNNTSPFINFRIINNPFPNETQHLKFSYWSSEDKNELFKLAQDREIGLNSGWKPHTTILESQRVIEKSYSNIYSYALRLKDDNKLIGYISLLPGDYSILKVSKYEAELGFWIGKDYWNKGYASEAIESLLDYAFNTIRYRKIWGGCLENNSISEHLFLKNNFKYSSSLTIEYLNNSNLLKKEKVFYLTYKMFQKAKTK